MDTILIVDDSRMNRTILRNVFDKKYRIIEAGDGEEAIQLIDSCHEFLSLVFLDLVMPKKSGIEVLQHICDTGMRDILPAIMITGDTGTESAVEAYEYGAADFVHKPFDAKIIMHRAENVMELYRRRRDIEKELDERTKALRMSRAKLEKTNDFLVNALGSVVGFRSLESGNHIKRVSCFTKILLNYVRKEFPKYGLTHGKINTIVTASLLHDVGKIGIPDSILNKPGRLTPEEFEIMKSHSSVGCEILECFKMDDYEEKTEQSGLNFYRCCYEICRWHHEKADGRGYPDGLKGDEIPIWSHAVAVADCFDALASKRVYKPAFGLEEAHRMILNGECGQFSDDLMHCFALAKQDLFDVFKQIQ
ncbi:MAG: response regulator [Selenomonadaceae bacterium]|nr:response regulator [Selenomonadaceae bacterium]